MGGALSVLVYSKWLHKLFRKKVIVRTSLFALATVLFLMSYPVLLVPNYLRVVLPVLAFILGSFLIGVFVPIQTYIQRVTPKGMYGRIYGTSWFFVTLITAVALALLGPLTEYLGVAVLFSLLSAGIFTLFLASLKYA
jgi:hypothetical protein